ncbi:hypothetical protein ACRALDRAFT_2028666 [Sodiomyces alcalophilus JCM 7366]|uniref:uncharacterized protein n=1 Tax=Sodiomyces alcalophilus JCM 7366 TaxID=591952 RepID=UPI0039B5C7A9
MAPKFKLATWLRSRFRRSNTNSRKQSTARPPSPRPPSPPYLPTPRPHSFTPSPSCEDLAITQIQPQSSSCLLFTRLPGDIRRDILILAFGKRTLHMDLVFDHPLILPPLADRVRAAPGNSYIPYPHAAINPLQRDDSSFDMPKVWRWGGTVCHRNAPWEPHSVIDWLSRPGPWEDFCDRANGGLCHLYGGEWPVKCQIGIMGFLLSCKQAYAEGIDILYGANCIAITSEPLLLHLPRLILPQRLASITSLELNINAHAERRSGQHTINISHLNPILEILATYCQALRSLYLSLQCDVLAIPRFLPASSILEKVDAFFLLMQPGGLRIMRLALPSTTRRTCSDSAVRPPVEHELEKTQQGQPSVMWRCFDGERGDKIQPETQIRNAGNFPRPPLQLPTPSNAGRPVPSTGYWIVENNDDESMLLMGTVCFGF